MRDEINNMREALASYIEATYHLSHPKVVDLRRLLLEGDGIAQTAYVESTPTYGGDRTFASLDLDKDVGAFLSGLAGKDAGRLLFDPPYQHQARALELAMAGVAGGTGIVVTSGTGSGKTESFLIPVLARLADEAIHRPDRFSRRAVRALLLYPMNALVNDQLGRLRMLFGAPAVRQTFRSSAGRPAKFGRYTGRTLYPGVRSGKRDQKRLGTLDYYLKIEDRAREGSAEARQLAETLRSKGRWPAKPDSVVGAFDGLRNWYGAANQRWEDRNGEPLRAIERGEDPELLTRHEIQAASPDLLVTNYSMLEYMLLRPIERSIFTETRAFFSDYPDEKFFLILDEAHLYRGANGTEVAYLIRRLLDRLGLPPSRVVFIATSASFSAPEAARTFVSGLFGISRDAITALTGQKRAFAPAGPGDAELAAALAQVDLGALRSASLRDRSRVLEPIAVVAPQAVGAKVTVQRIDIAAGDIAVTVGGLDASGQRIEERLVVPARSAAETTARFLVVDEVACPEGRVRIRRRYEIGEADAGGLRTTADDLPAALSELLAGIPAIGRLRNVTSGARSESDSIDQKAAWALTELPRILFPSVDDATGTPAVDALLELASLARPTPGDPPLLPARIHMLFRGLPGLWACANPNCDQIDASLRGGPTGKLYAEPRHNCGCRSQVYELHSCRSCGLAVARAHVGAPTKTPHLWQDNGQAYAGLTDTIEPIHVCLEDPKPIEPNKVRPAYLDLASGRLDGSGTFVREVWLPAHQEPKLFAACPRCEAVNNGPRASNGISDLQTKGEQPFQELISVQVLDQPPRPESDAPLKGRKALIFSDGRQTASRLAGTLKNFSFRDSVRPLLLAGMAALRQPSFRPSLDDAPLAVALGAAVKGVRLRPPGDKDGKLDRAGRDALRLIEDGEAASEDFQGLSAQTSGDAPRSVFQSIYAVLQDKHTGLYPLALAALRPKLTRTENTKLDEGLVLPAVAGSTADQVKAALIDLWLWQAVDKQAIKLQHTPDDTGAGGATEIREWNGKFSQNVQKLLAERGLKEWLRTSYANGCLPALRGVFGAGNGDAFFLKAARIALDTSTPTEWIRCERCTRVTPRNLLLGDRCAYCAGSAKPIDPTADPVFRSRKAFFRRHWERLNNEHDGYAPHQLVAEEHSAQLNDSGMANAMSRNEAYELRFQDIAIEQDGQTASPIDVLSCTTTMEVGIDIGGLTAVALRNVPPGRANYQQRAGRAGRRGSGLSTVIMFCGADSHDQSFFRDPGPIVAGPAPEPILNLDNPVIARRQAFAYLIGRFQQDRIGAVGGNSDVFSSLGFVVDFVNGAADAFSLAGLKQWIADGREGMRADLTRLFTASCPALDPDELLALLPGELEKHLIEGSAEEVVAGAGAPAHQDGDVADDSIEDASDGDHTRVDPAKLLDRLFDRSLLPKYAFPTDVATFSVFEESSDPWRPKLRYSPQQSLNAALSQYAPGHDVWIDGQRYISLGLYSEYEPDRIEAYRDKRLYFHCGVCNYADLKDWSDGYVGQSRDCPACSSRASLGPAKRWVRPAGFSHPPDFDPGVPLRPTRATLDALHFSAAARIDGARWPIGTGWEGWSESKTLVVTNRGSQNSNKPGFAYCTQCGRIEPADFDSGLRQLRQGQAHGRPRPRRFNEPNECSGQVAAIVLGNEFRTDVAVFRLALPGNWRLDPDQPSTTIAARSAVEALRLAACRLEDLEPNDIDGDFRFAPGAGVQKFIDLYLYDQASGGAGFVKTASRNPLRLVDAALKLLDDCTCDDSCYRCLRSYKNRFDHALLDRRIGADLLRACFKGEPLSIDAAREDHALNRLYQDLLDSGARVVQADGGLIDADGKVICLAHPFVDDQPCSQRARTLAEGRETTAVDILLVLRALPIATGQALSVPNVSPTDGLIRDEGGIPELMPAMIVAGSLSAGSESPRYTVAGAEPGDFLFRVAGNMLTGKNGDGAGGSVANGTLCLFRPFSGTPDKVALYLLGRNDGQAFGATRAGWTVGSVQPASIGGTRVRYRAASQYTECESEVVKPEGVVEVMAAFVKPVA